ncbi:hypothetical protein SAMN02745857_03763 [Andreprevotia lacus DSM 23236]|uniref:Glucosyl transferase GtrII n=1 Tax=Andreprevotia lacus DSM 23236 TaxID=1121001 RepID=A0A1W1XZL6_9NEIS|nr:DUF6056 family protein [Andreprevotia lacus]SMC29324.1 hypothetical protein SAMN02745857_03763 [Andreprevotia lacus DSM 23236]
MKLPRARPDLLLLLLATLNVLAFMGIFLLAPLNGEDYGLTRPFGDAPIADRLPWIAERIHTQFTTWNARLGEQLAIFWLSMPLPLFLLAAAATFLALNALVATLVSGRQDAWRKGALALCLIFPFWPGMEVFFWRTVVAGYLMPLIPTLLCLYCYAGPETLQRATGVRWRLALLMVIALLAGVSFENTPLAVLAFMLAAAWRHRHAVSLRLAALPIASMAAGWALLLSAPSTALRRQYYHQLFGIHGYTPAYIGKRLFSVEHTFFSSSSLLFFSALIAYWWLRRCGLASARLHWLLLPALIAVGTVVMAPYTEPRAFLLAWAIMLAVLVEAIYRLWQVKPQWRSGMAVLLAVALTVPAYAATLYSDFAGRIRARDAAIWHQIGQAACNIGLPSQQIVARYPYKFLNNRDDWFQANPGYVQQFFGCRVLMQPK